MEYPFLSNVEQIWESLRRMHALTLRQRVIAEKDSGKLLIELESSEARAEIVAQEALKSLNISVYRFKDTKVIADGFCNSNFELERKLRKLAIDLGASPFA